MIHIGCILAVRKQRHTLIKTLFYLFLGLVFSTCRRTTNESIFGTWSGQFMTISSEKTHESVSIPIRKYGYLTLTLHSDSSFEFILGVLKDVRVDKPIFGMNTSVLLIPAVYKTSRFGKYRHTDSSFVLTSKDGVIFAKHSDVSQDLQLSFSDEAGRDWKCDLDKKD